MPAASADEVTRVLMIVRIHDDAGSAPERLVQRIGGSIERQLPPIDGFVATVSSSAVERLRLAGGVPSVWQRLVGRQLGAVAA